MESAWKHIYPWIKTAVLNLESVDYLLRQVVDQIATAYNAECLLWAGMETGSADAMRVYGMPEVINRYAANLGFAYPPTPLKSNRDLLQDYQTVQQFHPRSLPLWLLDQQDTPRLTQLGTGDLIIPVTSRASATDIDAKGLTGATTPLQFVLQLSRSPINVLTSEPSIPRSPLPYPTANTTQVPLQTIEIHGWSLEEVESIEVICSQVGLAYSALYWRQRLEHSRQQVALVGRISHLLNSTLNPDEILQRIVAELGYGLQCDRSILVDLRHQPVNILAVWDHPDRELIAFEQRQIQRDYWQNVIEMFMNGGASYLQLGRNERDPDPLQEWLQQVSVLSVLLVPLFIQEEFFGAVALLSYRYERAYLLDELQTVRQVADQAAIALTNAQHYQSLWHKKKSCSCKIILLNRRFCETN
ncbi:MAG: GAF domain-containing protein [Cyanobacteria bacterium RU_5_0]|nr:GAF domain-containing protein [Cyanobacteria bacterium RU_5_0]